MAFNHTRRRPGRPRPVGRRPQPAADRDDLNVAAIRARLALERVSARAQGGAGPGGNSRLTAMTAVVLLVLLAIEGVTLLSLHALLPLHVFVGMLLLPPVALKLASTGYRFVRYYAGARAYRLAGPPRALMRALGPFVIAATLALFGTGVAMLALGPDARWLVGLHTASFVVWLVVTAIHVLGHLLHLPGLAGADLGSPGAGNGARLRTGAVAATVVVGFVLAVATVQYAAPWQALID